MDDSDGFASSSLSLSLVLSEIARMIYSGRRWTFNTFKLDLSLEFCRHS